MSAVPEESIAIVGWAGRFPGADSVESLWDNLCAGREGIAFFDKDEIEPSAGSTGQPTAASGVASGK